MLVSNIYPDFSSYTLSYQRTISFALFFFLGFMISQTALSTIYSSLKFKKWITVLAVSVVFVVSHFLNPKNMETLFRGCYGIEKLQSSNLTVYTEMFISYALSISLCYLFLNLLSNRKSLFTKWGERTLPIFLFHPIFVILDIKLQDFLPDSFALDVATIVILPLAVTVFLSSDWFIKISQYVCSPLNSIKKKVRRRTGAVVDYRH